MDEENLIISMYATHVGVPKSITKINRAEYVDTFSDLGIDTVISPKDLCCTDIVLSLIHILPGAGQAGGEGQTDLAVADNDDFHFNTSHLS